MVTGAPSDRSSRDKAAIRTELERQARERRVITYGWAAALVGRSPEALMPRLAERARQAFRASP